MVSIFDRFSFPRRMCIFNGKEFSAKILEEVFKGPGKISEGVLKALLMVNKRFDDSKGERKKLKSFKALLKTKNKS